MALKKFPLLIPCIIALTGEPLLPSPAAEAASGAPQAAVPERIVYSRVPRTQSTTFTMAGEEFEVQHLDVWDALPEVGFQFSGFTAPGQLVVREPDGGETVIYDCVTEGLPCVPFDAAVSLDGTRIAFAVYRSEGLKNRHIRANQVLPNKALSSEGRESQIFIYDLYNGQLVAWPHEPGNQDTNPIWLPNGRMMFSSNRHGTRPPFIRGASPEKSAPPRIYLANNDGSDVVDITPHEVGGALHPWLLNSGRVAYSSKWLSHNLPFVTSNGGVNWFGTLENMWVLADMDQFGGDTTALLGSHRNGIRADNGRPKNMKALHFVGQRANDDICVGNYYRRNNLGLGDVWCFAPQDRLLEGPAPDFLPRPIYNVANWSKSNDEPSRDDSRAKAGFPEGTADNQLLMTVGQGWCTSVAYSWRKTPEKIGDRKGCDAGIYKTTRIPSKSLDDLQRVVDSEAWHEFNARVIHARPVPAGELSASGSDACLLASSDAGSTDAHHYGEYVFNDMYRAMANNGGEIYGLPHAQLDAIRFYEVEPNGRRRVSNITGNDLRLLGDVPLLADKSFSVEVPCDTPLLMAGVDSDGRVIKRDQVPMSLRPGEKRVCTGCHLHGSEGRAWEQSLAFTAIPPQLLKSKPLPKWQDDIGPMLRNRCAGCHASFGNYEKLTYDPYQKHAVSPLQLREHKRRSRAFGLHRPATSKYVNSMFARESMLYWVAAGERTDGRSDDDYPDDLDYPQNHPDVGLPPWKLKRLAAWLDGGYPR